MPEWVPSDEIMRVVEGQTVPSEFLRMVREHRDAVALRWKNDDDTWGEWTFGEYADEVAKAVAGYRAHGVSAGDKVLLMMRNIPQFHVLDMAAYFCGAAAVSIYNSSSADQVLYLANHAGAVLAVVQDNGFLERFLKVRDELETLRTLVVLEDPDGLAPSDVLGIDRIMQHGVADLDEAVGACRPDDLATMIYTSGTTGPPKGVMLTHRNITFTAESLRRCLPFETYVGKRVVSYLPMAHIAERVTSHYSGAFFGYEVTTCPDPTAIATYAREVHPNFMFGVPRVWEKIYAGVNAALAADPEKGRQFNEAVEAAKPIVAAMDWGHATDEQLATYQFLDEVAFRPVRQLVGLDQLEAGVTGAAPIPAEILEWFRAIGIPLSEIYGLSETSGPMTWTATKVKPGTVGPAIPGCEVTLADDGEIICRGGNVFEGYYNEPAKTAEAIDDDGWFHSGDIGVIDEDGYVKIVDRKKELIITAGGKNISPANLEAALKMIPLVGQAMAIGDKRPFVSAIVTLDPEIAPAWARAQGIGFETMEDLANDAVVREEVEKGVTEVMSQFNNAERVKKVKILGEEWLPDSDVLTPTSKLKRRGVLARYDSEIEGLYA
ncbi:MAG: AMP-binding protein [Acidimicrobiales bacterium]|jgi:long-chain acyl-CoA synthetase|nr:AMP-binding protein [Acidimicrobiales bacterium]